MKKILSIFLAIMVVFTLTGCKGLKGYQEFKESEEAKSLKTPTEVTDYFLKSMQGNFNANAMKRVYAGKIEGIDIERAIMENNDDKKDNHRLARAANLAFDCHSEYSSISSWATNRCPPYHSLALLFYSSSCDGSVVSRLCRSADLMLKATNVIAPPNITTTMKINIMIVPGSISPAPSHNSRITGMESMNRP